MSISPGQPQLQMGPSSTFISRKSGDSKCSTSTSYHSSPNRAPPVQSLPVPSNIASITQDDDDISMISNVNVSSSNHGDKFLVISPCVNFLHYGSWLQQHFPNVIDDEARLFVQNVLHIRSEADLEDYLTLTPIDYVKMLGTRTYIANLDLLVELKLI